MINVTWYLDLQTATDEAKYAVYTVYQSNKSLQKFTSARSCEVSAGKNIMVPN